MADEAWSLVGAATPFAVMLAAAALGAAIAWLVPSPLCPSIHRRPVGNRNPSGCHGGYGVGDE